MQVDPGASTLGEIKNEHRLATTTTLACASADCSPTIAVSALESFMAWDSPRLTVSPATGDEGCYCVNVK